MDVKTKRMYSEVYALLDALGETYISRLPRNLYHLIETSRDEHYVPIYKIETLENETGINRDSLAMIALFHLNYWCDNEEEKKELEELLEENDRTNKESLKSKYDLQKVLGKETKSTDRNAYTDEKTAVETTRIQKENSLVKKENFLIRILKKIFHSN